MQHLELRKLDEPKLGPVLVDFVEGAVAHRRKFGGGRGQSIAKAVGLKSGASTYCGLHGWVESVVCIGVTRLSGHDAGASSGGRSVAGGWFTTCATRQRNLVTGCVHPDVLRCQFNIKFAAVGFYTRCGVSRPDVLSPEIGVVKRDAGVSVVVQLILLTSMDALLLPLAVAGKRVVVKRPDYAGFLNDMPPGMGVKLRVTGLMFMLFHRFKPSMYP